MHRTANDHHNPPMTDDEVMLPQYGPKWVAFVLAGGDLRKGNIARAEDGNE